MPSRHHRNANRSTPKSPSSSVSQLPQVPQNSHSLLDVSWTPPQQHGMSTSRFATQLTDDDDDYSNRVSGDPDPPLADAQLIQPPSLELSGHSRSPVLAREPTMLESLSRTVRNYVPSSVPLSIPIPTAVPSPPLVSKPISFGSFASPSRTTHYRDSSAAQNSSLLHEGVFASDEDLEGISQPKRRSAGYMTSRSDSPEEVIWSRWSKLHDRTLLLLGYRTGLQIWDCTDLKSVQEIFNTRSGRVLCASILSRPHVDDNSDDPLLGMITGSGSDTTFIIYSLSRHHIVKSIEIPNLYTFLSSPQFIVLSTNNPPTLHIMSTTTLTTLHVIPSTYLSLFSRKSKRQDTCNDVSLPDVDIHEPIFDLSSRLLAYASPIPSRLLPSSTSITGRLNTLQVGSSHPSPPPSASGTSSLPFGHSVPMTQAELGNAAYKVGGSVLSGMMSLGGMAFTAATKAGDHVLSRAGNVGDAPLSGFTNKIFSPRSAPTGASSNGWRGAITSEPLSARTTPVADGYHVVILDLAPLLNSKPPTTVAHLLVSKHQPIGNITFTEDGTSVIVSPADGRVLKVFRVNPRGTKPINPLSMTEGDSHNPPSHIYNLRRGRTSAIIETVQCARDGRWVAVGTNHRTVHIFPTNSYGGKPDIRSHIEGKVRNVDELQSFPTDMQPLVRFRLPSSSTDHSSAPISFLFLETKEASLPASLLPPVSPTSPYARSSGSLDTPSAYPERTVSRYTDRPRNYQDVLVFDPIDGKLSLRRFFAQVRGGGDASPSSGNSNLSVSPSRSSQPTRISGLTQMMEPPSDLSGSENMIATWTLSRHPDWEEIRQPRMQCTGAISDAKAAPLITRNWLAEAELSTSSRSLRVLPRSIYLSHQFFFYTLGEDYHALIRLYRLGITGTKLEMRKQVEISSHSMRNGASFVEGFSPTHTSQATSSFDEPLASAISAEIDYSISPSVLPMLPNGTPKQRYLRNAIPIRSVAAGLSDGMSEGLGRIRREMTKAKSPRSSSFIEPSTSVPLEFDEDDEDFLTHPTGTIPEKDTQGGSADKVYRSIDIDIAPPASATDGNTSSATPEEDESWQGWDEDKQVVEDVERFDDINVVGFLEEEQEDVIRAQREREEKERERKAALPKKKRGRKK